jgi:hypothetical protein
MSSNALWEWSAHHALAVREQPAIFLLDPKSVEVMFRHLESVSSTLSVIRDQLSQQQEYTDTGDVRRTKKRRVVSRIIVYGTTPF